MATLLQGWEIWLTAVVFVACMLAAWYLGWLLGRRAPTVPAEDPSVKFTDASMALLGLLLAFTFSMALGRHDQRRLAVVADSNSIGDFYTCAALLKEPHRSALQEVIRDYARLRFDMDRGHIPPPEQPAALERCRAAQAKMTELVARAVQDGTPATVPLTNTLNNLTSSHASRIAAYQESLPQGIVLLLLVSAVTPAFLIGQQQGESTKIHLAGTIAFMVVVGLVVFAILDLNQPASGMITVNLNSLEQTVRSMER